MAKAYSMDLRERVVAAYDEGRPPADIARQFRVSRAWVYRLVQRRRESGSIEPRRERPMGRKPKLKPHHQEQLRQLVEAHPDATLAELRERLSIRVGMTTLWRALRGLGLTLKKSAPRRRTTTARRGGAPSALAYRKAGAGSEKVCFSR